MRLGQLALLLALVQGSAALWPFKPKRFTAETLLNAGSLGLEGVKGRVLAIADANGDRNSDLFVLSEDKKTVSLYLWNRDTWRYTSATNLTFATDVVNVVPGDYNSDGRLDLLVMMLRPPGMFGGGGKETEMTVVLGGPKGLDSGGRWELSPSTTLQPIVFDDDGHLRPSLLGFQPSSEGPAAMSWRNDGTGMTPGLPPLYNGRACQLVTSHSSAYVDIDGDCRPDIVLHCQGNGANDRSLQFWLNVGQLGEQGYSLTKSLALPVGSRSVTFADMNRDGAMDLVFATCKKHSVASGMGTDCSVNVVYNQQAGLCKTETSRWFNDRNLACRGWGDLCQQDSDFQFDITPRQVYFTTIPLEELFPGENAELMLSVPGSRDIFFIPLPLRPGDFDVDGFPDLLMTVKTNTGNQVKVLQNVPCGKGIAGCDSNGRGMRGFVVGKGKGWAALEAITDAVGASWIDLDDDGSLDIMVHRTGAQDGSRVTFIQNNFYHDTFFLKAQVLHGVCDGDCVPTDGSPKYSPSSSYSGATFKFTAFDTGGARHAQQVAQLPQTANQALMSPHSFIGLGRTNNYIENLMVGTSLLKQDKTNLESLIPNSQLLISTPWTAKEATLPVQARSKEWRSELFLHPGDWIPWVAAAVVGTVVTLGMVVVWLGEREKKEDEKERRRALHAINFQAL